MIRCVNLLYSHSVCLQRVEETSLLQIQPVHLRTADHNKHIRRVGHIAAARRKTKRDTVTISGSNILSPRPHKVEVTRGVVVGEVSSKLWNTGLVVVSVLGVELYVAVAQQKHQLHSSEETGKSSERVILQATLTVLMVSCSTCV